MEALDRNTAQQHIIDAARLFYDRGWLLGTAGNLSVRLSASPLKFVITASGVDKGLLSHEDFVVVDAQGQLTEASSHKASAETLLHAAIYQAYPHAGAVYHVHSVAGTTLSQTMPAEARSLRFEGLEMIKGLGFNTHETSIDLPVVDNHQDMAYLGQCFPEVANPEVPGLMLKGHGIYTWGRTPFEAKRHIEIWEFLFQVSLNQRLLGALPSPAHTPLPIRQGS